MNTLDELLQAGLGSVFTAASVEVRQRGAVIYQAAAGSLDPEGNLTGEYPRVRRDTQFDYASLTKLFTTAAFFRLVDAGHVNIDTPVIEVLPAFGGKRPIRPYGAAKLASEAILLGHAEAFGFTVRCQRYINVFGPRQDPRSPYSGVISIFCDRLGAGKTPTIYGDGEQTRDFISVYDVARANVLAATSAGIVSGVANICTGRATSLNQLVAVLRTQIANAPAAAYAEPKAADIRHSLGAPDAARAQFGFAAGVTLEEGLAAIVKAG
jgi:nucleoside-diphosphate-sugar epimerase